MDKTILKSELMPWLRSLSGRYRVIGPVKQDEGPALYRDIDSDSEIMLENTDWTMSPREYLLPQEEQLFSVRGKDDEQQVMEPERDARPVVLAGLRACDAGAIQVLDNVYLNGQFRDPYYAARREVLILVGTVCTEARWSCFCTSVGNPVEWLNTLDVTLTDIGERVLIQSRTKAGDALLTGANFTDAAEADKLMAAEILQQLAETPMQPFAGKDIAAALDWDHPVWAEIGMRCLACGICNYLCPSCSCFDIQDEVVSADCVERFRCRDTCQFSDFTRMGAGHNPRAAQMPRSRQRIMHKFKYQPEQFGLYGCTGCGRCIEACPVNIDIRRVLEEAV